MKWIWLTCFSLPVFSAMPQPAFAQDDTLMLQHTQVLLPDTLVKTTYIQLRLLYKEEVLPGKMNFSGVSFLDNRSDTSKVGYLYQLHHDRSHSCNLWVKANLANGLAPALGNYVDTYFRNSLSPDKDSLVVRIKDFRVGYGTVYPQGDIMGIFPQSPWLIRVRLEIAQKQKDQLSLLGVLDTVFLFKKGGADFAGSFIQVIRSILLKGNALTSDTSRRVSASPEERFPSTLDHPILKDSVLNKGAYADFSQFLINRPSYPICYRKDTGVIREYPITSFGVRDSLNKEVDPGKIWGFCDGKRVYVRNGCCTFYPFDKDDRTFTCSLFKTHNALALQPTVEKPKEKIHIIPLLILLPLFILAAEHQVPIPAISTGGDPVLVERPYYMLVSDKKHYIIWGTDVDMQTGKVQF